MTMTLNGSPGSAPASAARSSALSRRPLTQRAAADPHIAREDGTGQPGRGAPARVEAKDLHADGWLALVAS